jgi:hypothetical protein
MFENKKEPLISQEKFLKRLYKMTFLAVLSTLICLFIGMVGYHYLCQMGWIDAMLNASMILSGMGPVNIIYGSVGKIFASFYAIFSGVMFVTNISIFFAPIIHRYLHIIHLED